MANYAIHTHDVVINMKLIKIRINKKKIETKFYIQFFIPIKYYNLRLFKLQNISIYLLYFIKNKFISY